MRRTNATLVRVTLAAMRFGIAFVMVTWAAFVLGCLFSGGASVWQLVAGLAGGVVAAIAPHMPRRDRIASMVVVTAVAIAAWWLAVTWPDCSWDGALYHQPAIFALADGWNPVRDGAAALPAFVWPGVADHLGACPKAAWMVGAVLYRATGDVAAANAIHWLLLLAPFGPALFLSRVRARHGVVRSLLVATVVAANPVVVYQATTAYVDGLVASLLGTLVIALLASRNGRAVCWLIVAGASAALLVGVKLTGVVYAGIVAVVFVMAAWRRHGHPLRVMLVVGCGLLVGLGLASDSYISNAAKHGNPFHPVWQPGGTHAISNQASGAFQSCGRIEQVVRAIASAPHADTVELSVLPAPRWPLSVWKWPARYDPRFCGFGPLFLEAALLAFVLWCCRGPRLGVAAIAVVASALATEAAWWARLAPQWWLLPILPLLGTRHRSARGWLWLERVLIGVLLVNVFWVARATLRDANRIAGQWDRATASEDAPTIARYLSRPEHEYTVQRRLRERRARS